MDKKKVLILASVLLCMAMFLVELSMIQIREDDRSSIIKVKSTFQADIQALKDGKYENLTATDFEASIEDVENVYDLQILHPDGYTNQSFLEDFSFVIEEGISQETENNLELLWTPNYKNQKLCKDFEVVNQVIDDFFQTKVDKSSLNVHYLMNEDEYDREIEYNKFQELLKDGFTTYRNSFSVFGNETQEGGFMIQIGSILNGAWFSRGELGDIMPSFNDCKIAYPYLSGKRQVEDAVLHLLNGDILLSEMEQKVREYLNSDAFPLPQTEGIHYEIGTVLVIENEKYEEYDGVCFIIRRVYEGVPFECGPWGTWYECDTSEISYARSDVPDTMRDFWGLNGEVVEMKSIPNVISVGDALDVLSDYFGTKNGMYEIRGVELVYKNCRVPSEDMTKISDILEPKWKFVVCPSGSGREINYFINAETGEIG